MALCTGRGCISSEAPAEVLVETATEPSSGYKAFNELSMSEQLASLDRRVQQIEKESGREKAYRQQMATESQAQDALSRPEARSANLEQSAPDGPLERQYLPWQASMADVREHFNRVDTLIAELQLQLSSKLQSIQTVASQNAAPAKILWEPPAAEGRVNADEVMKKHDESSIREPGSERIVIEGCINPSEVVPGELDAALAKSCDTDDKARHKNIKFHSHKPSIVFRMIHIFDRWGEPAGPRMQKNLIGGFCGIALCCALIAYVVILYLNYDDRQASSDNKILWSILDGPYPVPITCYAEHCLVSVEVGSVSYAPACLSMLPKNQEKKCFSLGKGEELVLQLCYSQLPTQGIHVHFGGSRAWKQLKPKLHQDLGVDSDRYGFAIVSDMLASPYDPNNPVMLFPTPIRSGRNSVDYVKTLNKTVPDGSPGAKRHEWFSKHLDDKVYSGINACTTLKNSMVAKGINSISSSTMWEHALISMGNSFIQKEVAPPPGYLQAALGEVGGALELGQQLLALPLLLVWQSMTHQGATPEALDEIVGTLHL